MISIATTAANSVVIAANHASSAPSIGGSVALWVLVALAAIPVLLLLALALLRRCFT